MKPQRRVFIAGGSITPFIGKYHPDFIWKGHPDAGRRDNPTVEQHLTTAIRAALAEAGAKGSQIERGYVGNFAGGLFVNQLHMGSLAARADEGLDGVPFSRVEGACASGGLAIVGAIEAIQSGRNVTLAAGAEVQTTYSARDGAEFLARASHYETERSLDEFAFPAMFARRTQAYAAATGLERDRLSVVVDKAYRNANRNPLAHMHTVELAPGESAAPGGRNAEFLSNPEYRPWLRVLECSPVSDGGSAVVLVSEDGLAELGLRAEDCVEVVSWGHRTGALGLTHDHTRLLEVQRTIEEALSSAGVALADLGVAEVHDCFAISEVMMMEALGLAAYGRGLDAIADGRTELDGELPVNTGGGLIAFGHPIGATGIKQVLEVARQMRGACGTYQIAKRPTHGVTVNMGGDDRTCVSFVLRAPGA
mgnify:CR=1 FL=1